MPTNDDYKGADMSADSEMPKASNNALEKLKKINFETHTDTVIAHCQSNSSQINNIPASSNALDNSIRYAEIKAAVDPKHYKDYLPDMQWLEAMQYRFSPEGFKDAVELQIRKYMDREKKDDPFQELSKALWYMKFLVAFMKNDCIPIKIKDVEKILKR
jgi:hypothetical protein